jgi:L-ascorbate metabolism protein UlaG (beta-lactamase superfamily)
MTAVSVQWWGHATTSIELGGLRFLTDPLLSGRLVHLRRIGGEDPGPDALRADTVLISHLHSDHLHIASMLRLSPSLTVIAPSGTRALLFRQRALASRVDEVGPGDVRDMNGVRITAIAAAHDGRRSPVSRHSGPALGFVLEHGDQRIWFAGDTGPSAAMADLAPIGIALVPVGGWGPTLGPGHLDPVTAAHACQQVAARHAVPIHYGTFWPLALQQLRPANFQQMFTSPGLRFADSLRTASPDTVAHVLSCGDLVRIAL